MTKSMTIDLSTENGKEAYYEFQDTPSFQEASDCLRFLETGESPLRFKKINLLTHTEGFLWGQKNVYRSKSYFCYLSANILAFKPDMKGTVAFFFVPSYKNRTQGNKSIKVMPILNGDGDVNIALVEYYKDLKLPVCSFRCLTRFYKGSEAVLCKKIDKEEIVLLDYTSDDHIPLTKEEKLQARTEKGRLKLQTTPPRPGFTLMAKEWHRSGSVLLHDTKQDMYILMGQDEGTYFGVELPKACKTIQQAYDALIPKEVKGKPYIRQGEWFIVNVSEKKVPKMADCVVQFEGNGYVSSNIFLPLETAQSNKHEIIASDGRVSKDGRVFVKDPSLVHDQHADASMTGWCSFYKNTALRSYSEEGVD